jgi:hypothetical protein
MWPNRIIQFHDNLSPLTQPMLQTATQNRFAFHRAAKMRQLDGRPKHREGGTSEVAAWGRQRGASKMAVARREQGGCTERGREVWRREAEA